MVYVALDEVIWVSEDNEHWVERHFAYWPEEPEDMVAVYCWSGKGTTSEDTYEGDVYGWNFYSLTDPAITTHSIWFE